MELKLTPSGQDLLKRALAGETVIDFTALQLGNGADGGEDASALSNPLLTAELSGIDKGDIFVTLTATFANSEVTAGFRCTETGVLAKDPDNDGGTLLYAYGYTKDAEADYIPAGSARVLETQMDVLVYIGDAENVTASISESLVYASRADLEAHIKDTNNPHEVTAAQVGLGNVKNVSTNDQTPTYTAASTLTALVSGEKLSVAFGKIAKAVLSLIDHLTNTSNPHKVTAAQAGAAEKSHKHSTADITSGIMGLARGGTGVTSYSALREKLGLGSGTGVLAVKYGGTSVATEAELWRNKRSTRYVVGTSQSGWTAKDCDYLCDGTDDQEEINAALTAVKDGGGTVLLLDGAYSCSGSITFVKAGTELRGTAGAKITFTADDLHILCKALNDCAIRGLYVIGRDEASSTSCGVYANSCERLAIQDCTFAQIGVKINNSTHCIVQGNVIGLNRVNGHSVELECCSNCTITGNNIYGGYYNIYLYKTSKTVISSNVCTEPADSAIETFGDTNLIISSNIICSASAHTALYLNKTRNSIVTGNYMMLSAGDMDVIRINSGCNFAFTSNIFISAENTTPIRLNLNVKDGIIQANFIIGAGGITTGIHDNYGSTNIIIADNLVTEYTDDDA